MKNILLLLALAAPSYSLDIFNAQSNGQPITPTSVVATSVTVSAIPPNSVVTTGAGGALTAVSTFSYLGGNVGIGTANPIDKLHISSPTADILIDGLGDGRGINLRASGGGKPTLTYSNVTTGGLGDIYFNNTKDLIVDTNFAAGAGASALVVKASGNVGIGTTNPQFKLHMSSGEVYLDGNGAKIEVSSGSASAVLSSCGVSPTVSGANFGITDIAGRFQAGTAPGTGCVITFQTAYLNPPICSCQDEAATFIGCSVAPAAGGASITLQGVFATNNILDYFCVGRR